MWHIYQCSDLRRRSIFIRIGKKLRLKLCCYCIATFIFLCINTLHLNFLFLGWSGLPPEFCTKFCIWVLNFCSRSGCNPSNFCSSGCRSCPQYVGIRWKYFKWRCCYCTDLVSFILRFTWYNIMNLCWIFDRTCRNLFWKQNCLTIEWVLSFFTSSHQQLLPYVFRICWNWSRLCNSKRIITQTYWFTKKSILRVRNDADFHIWSLHFSGRDSSFR